MLKRRAIHVIVAAVVLATSAGCLGPLSYRPKPKKVAAPVHKKKENLPAAPDAKANNATLAGIDTTGSGVRDDVKIWIFSNYSSPSQRTALMEVGKALQNVIASTPKTADDAKKLQEPVGAALQQLQRIPGLSKKLYEELQSTLYLTTVNTPERSKAYLQYSLLLPPQAVSWEAGPFASPEPAKKVATAIPAGSAATAPASSAAMTAVAAATVTAAVPATTSTEPAKTENPGGSSATAAPSAEPEVPTPYTGKTIGSVADAELEP